MTEASSTEASAPPATELVTLMAQLGGVLLSVETVETTVNLVTKLAAETIADTAGAGVTLVDERGRRSTASSNSFVAEVDALQYAFGSGPCLSAWSQQAAIRIDDLDEESRWPQWTAAAAGLGVRSMLSVPLLATGASVGAMKVYSRQPDAYDLHAVQVLSMFAQQAAALLTNVVALSDARQLSTQLTEALENRDLIGQAKGVLMAQGAKDEQAAFAMLVSASQRSNVKLHEVARQLVASAVRSNADPQPSS